MPRRTSNAERLNYLLNGWSEHNRQVLFHIFLPNLLDAVRDNEAWWTSGNFDGGKIDKLKWIAYLLDSTLLLMGRFSHEGKFSYHTWNIRRRRLNGSAALHELWNKKWTGDLSRKVFRYCRTIYCIVNSWLTSETFTSLQTFRLFAKVS